MDKRRKQTEQMKGKSKKEQKMKWMDNGRKRRGRGAPALRRANTIETNAL